MNFDSLPSGNTVYIGPLSPPPSPPDSNDPNIIFSCELPSSTNENHNPAKLRKEKGMAKQHTLQTRVILNPPNHSKIAREFLLVQGGLTTEEILRFHRPCLPNRELLLNVRLSPPLPPSASSRGRTPTRTTTISSRRFARWRSCPRRTTTSS